MHNLREGYSRVRGHFEGAQQICVAARYAIDGKSVVLQRSRDFEACIVIVLDEQKAGDEGGR